MFLLVTLPNIHRFKKITDTLRLLLRPREGSAEYCDERVCVCVFVCPRSCLRNYTSDLHGIFCACYPWPWLGPPLAAYTLCIEQTLPWRLSVLNSGYTCSEACMVPDVMMGSLPLLKISITSGVLAWRPDTLGLRISGFLEASAARRRRQAEAARLTLTRSRMLGAYEYPLQAADVQDYFLQSGPTRP